MRERRRTSRGRCAVVYRSLQVLVGLVTVGAIMTGCARTGADEPVRTGASQGYIGGASAVTIIEPQNRKTAAVLKGQDLEDRNATVSTADVTDKVIVLNVWGSWCAPCRKEAPDLAAASVSTKKVATFIGLNIRDSDPAPAQAFVRAFKIPYASIYDPDGQELVKLAADLPPSAIPTTLVIDRKGRSAVRVIGTISERSLVDIINDVAAGR